MIRRAMIQRRATKAMLAHTIDARFLFHALNEFTVAPISSPVANVRVVSTP